MSPLNVRFSSCPPLRVCAAVRELLIAETVASGVFVLKADAVVNVIATTKLDLSAASQVSAAILKAAGKPLQEVTISMKRFRLNACDAMEKDSAPKSSIIITISLFSCAVVNCTELKKEAYVLPFRDL